MEKRLRSSLHTSAEEFLTAAVKQPFKSSKASIKSLITTSIDSSSELASSLPLSLRNAISHSISQFSTLQSDPNFVASPSATPPAKRVRRSGRNRKRNEADSPSKAGGQSVAEKLLIYAYIVRICAFHTKNVFSESDLLPAVKELHDKLVLFESESDLLSEIANLCEEWWKWDLEGREGLISQSLPVIVSRSLTLKKKGDVHRVYMLREAFSLLDFEDESIEDLKNLMIRCVISPLYLKTEDGRKFIAFMFGLSVQLVKEVFAMMKSQIPFGRKSMLEAYGEILFKAWKVAEGGGKYEIEDRILQGLYEGAIYASSDTLAASIRRVLGGFVIHRTTEGVEKLIFRLAEPLIFRSLQVANSNVRQNALHLLLDLFPLEDPDATKEASGTLLEKQFFLMEKLLMDECPDVRSVAVEGCCRTLNLFWEVIPSSSITKIITRIFDQMTVDACTEVRLSTVNGVIYLIGNPQSHEVLKVLLPRLGNLILDSASAVRAAVMDLFLCLNDVPNFHFHKVVQMDNLLSTLANDLPHISKKITKLLIPSYFPSKVTEEEACKRCITLIKRSPMAGARFCEFAASEGASPKSLLKLFKVIIGLTMSATNLDENVIEGLLLAASHLCTDLGKDASLLAALKEELSAEKLNSLFAVASSPKAQSSVCNIISTIGPDCVDELFEETIGLIRKCDDLPDNIGRQAEVRSAHKMILSSGWFCDMFEAFVGLLEKAAQGCREKFSIQTANSFAQSAKRKKSNSSEKLLSKSKSRRGKKFSKTNKDTFLKDCATASGVAWQIRDLLLSEDSRKEILGSDILGRAYTALKAISEASILHSQQYDNFDASSISTYTALALHISLHNIKLDGFQSPTQANISNLTMDHLVHCINKVLGGSDSISSCKIPTEVPECSKSVGESQTGDHVVKRRRISDLVKISTSVLKYIGDATAMDLIPCCEEKTLIYAAEIIKFIITRLREQAISLLEFTEEELKDINYCVKSSFSYAAKLLNVTLKSCDNSLPQAGVYSLVNELFNIIVAAEEFLGHKFAARLISVVQPWMPDLILGLGSRCLLKQSLEECTLYNPFDKAISLPSWLNTIARIELHEVRDAGSDEEEAREEEFSAFKRHVETMSQLSQENVDVLDAVGVIFLAGSLAALENRNFDLVLGLLHFVSVKLVGPEDQEWSKCKLMLASVGDLYPKLEKESEDPNNRKNDRKQLLAARALLEPVWMLFMHENRRQSMEAE